MARLRAFRPYDVLVDCHDTMGHVTISRSVNLAVALIVSGVFVSSWATEDKNLWKPVGFAIVKFNDQAPKSWNIYHTEKKGLLLVRLWKIGRAHV